MKYLDLTTEPSIAPLLSMLRQMTKQSSSSDILGEFMGQYSRVRPIDSFVGVVPIANDPDNKYRITYAVRAADAVNGRIPHTRDMSNDALNRITPITPSNDDIFAILMEDDLPKMVFDIPKVTLPQLTSIVGNATACMALPIYEGDRIVEWAFTFSNTRIDQIHARDIGQALTVANLLGSANRHVDLLEQVNKLNNALREQIDAIARVQQSLLPNRLPDIPGFHIASSYLTSDAAGGDYFDFFRLPGGEWGVLIADVSGHGPAAATVMAMLHAILHAYPTSDVIDPSSVLTFANQRLYDAGLEGSFVTAFFAVINPATGVMRYSNCGHNPPRLLRITTEQRVISCSPLIEAATIPLGVLDSLPDVCSANVILHPGDRLVLYTDGITEAFDDNNQMFGEQGLDDALTEREFSADEIVESIHCGLFRHHGMRPRADDQTIVILHYHTITSGSMENPPSGMNTPRDLVGTLGEERSNLSASPLPSDPIVHVAGGV